MYQQPQVAAAAAEDPDDVPMEKKESVEDKMIQAVADYQQEQKEAQAKKFARDNAKVKKQIADVKKVEVEEATKAAAEAAKEEADETAERAAVKKVKEEEEHFKKMRLEAEETAEVQQAKALRDYKAKIAAKEAKAEELQKEAKAEQRKALADYEEAQKVGVEGEGRERKREGGERIILFCGSGSGAAVVIVRAAGVLWRKLVLLIEVRLRETRATENVDVGLLV